MIERLGDFTRNACRVSDGQWTFTLDALTQRRARDIRHCIVDEAVALTGLKNRQDIRVLELRGYLDFSEKALVRRRTVLAVEHLDGDTPAQAKVGSEVHDRHSAAADLVVDLVSALETALEPEELRVHRRQEGR